MSSAGSLVVAEPPTDERPAETPVPSALPLVAFVLGISGVVLGATVVWYFAAFPLGLGAIVVGVLGLRRSRDSTDPRARSRATIGLVLGVVAIVLAVSAAFLLPRAVDAVDEFFTAMQDDVNANVDSVNDGLRSDVRSLDRTVTRDLARLESQNRSVVDDLDSRTSAALTQLEDRINESIGRLDSANGAELAQLEASLRADIRALDQVIRDVQASATAQITALEARIERIEQDLGIG